MATVQPARSGELAGVDSALQVALEALPWGMAVLDVQGTIIAVNFAWRRASRRSVIDRLHDGIGTPYLEYCERSVGLSAPDLREMRQAVHELAAGASTECVFEYPCHDPDRRLLVRLRGDMAGRRLVTAVHQDVTDRRQVEEARRAAASRELEALVDARTRELSHANQELRVTETRFRAAASATADLILEVDLTSNRLEWFGGDVDALFGYPPGGFPRQVDAIVELIHPDDRAPVTRSVVRAIRAGKSYQVECRIQCTDGSYRDWECSGQVVSVVEGRPKLLIAANRDITERKQAEAQLRASEQRFRTVADTTTDLVFEAGIESDRVEWHGNIDGLLGYEGGAFPRTVSGWLESVHPEDVDPMKEAMARALETGRFSASFRIRCRDGSCRDWEGRGRVSPGGVDSHVVVGAVTDVTEREAMMRSRRDTQRRLRELTTRLFTAQEDERRRLALELHDGFGQQIAAVSIQLGSLRQDRGLAADTCRELARIQAQVVELSNDFRRVSHQLHPAALEQLGLEAALRAHCASLRSHEGISVSFESKNCPTALPHETAICVFRVAQTALDNVARHAGARVATVRLVGVTGPHGSVGLGLRVTDDGRGFDVSEARHKGGLGLVSMEERVRPLGGRFEIHSEVGSGTEIRAFVPVAGNDEDGNGSS